MPTRPTMDPTKPRAVFRDRLTGEPYLVTGHAVGGTRLMCRALRTPPPGIQPKHPHGFQAHPDYVRGCEHLGRFPSDISGFTLALADHREALKRAAGGGA